MGEKKGEGVPASATISGGYQNFGCFAGFSIPDGSKNLQIFPTRPKNKQTLKKKLVLEQS